MIPYLKRLNYIPLGSTNETCNTEGRTAQIDSQLHG